MKTIITSLILATTLLSASADADDRRGLQAFARFVSAVAEAAQEGRRAHDMQRGNQQYAQEYGQGYDAGYAGYEDYGPYIVDLSGDWMLSSGGVNRFQRTHQGYYVIPVGRGRGVHYIEIGDNLYQDANSSGTYEVIDDNYMVWRSNDKRNRVIELFRR